MTEAIATKAKSWLSSQIDQETKDQIKYLMDHDEKELAESFYQDLEFGTGGLRGIMGVGSNRMNKYTVGMATQGLANYLNRTFADKISVAIAYDSRNNSKSFAQITANVFSSNGITVYLFPELRPTPELSFAIRTLGCKSGVVITASHNPKEYNGYKAYWEDGAQVVPPHDKNVIREVKSITSLDEVRFEGNPDLIHVLDNSIDEKYLNAIESESLSMENNKKHRDIKIVFSSIHGTGITMVPEILNRYGFENVTIIEEQKEPNGDFPTVVYPNPEEAEAMNLALIKAQEIKADLIMATDPDSDRVGIGCRNVKGEYQLLNGNQTGALLFDYFLRKKQEQQALQETDYTVNTIVSSNLLNKVSEGYGVKAYETLTGFKNIAAMVREKEGKEKYLIGGEESYGYMIGDFVRDKDAIASCAIIAEMAAYHKEHGRTIFEALIHIYQQFGFFKEKLVSITKKGMDGAQEIKEMMEDFRKKPPKKLAGSSVTKVLDYLEGTSLDLADNTTSQLPFDSSNVLQFFTEDETKISARPSGTEPKIKFYVSVKEDLDSPQNYETVNKKLEEKIARILEELNLT
jgi:phosphoglucomutase